MSTEWRRIGLFVSSTFDDMHAERDYLVKRVLPQLQEWCEARRLHLADVDLRWGITEAAATRERGVVLKCLQAIDGTRPLFLCLVGQRRGRVTAPEDVAEATFEAYPEARAQIGTATVTEIEIAHAMGDGDRRRPGALFYLRDPEALTGLPPILRGIYTNDWLDDPDERARHAEAQEATKELARRRAVVTREYLARWDTGATTPELALPVECPFADPERIRAWQQRWAAAGVAVTGTVVPPQLMECAEAHNCELTAGRLTRFVAGERTLAQTMLADLQAAIVELHPDRADPGQDDAEADQQEQFLARAVEAPIERRATYDALDAYADGDDDGVFAITASSGIGKTTVLAKWIARHPQRPLARFIGASDGSTSIDGLLASIVREATGADPAEPATLRDTWTRQASGVVVLDALDQLDTGLDDLDWLPWTLPPGLKVIVSYATDAPAGAQLRDRMEAGEPVVHRLEPFDDLEQRRAIVADYLSGYLKELDAELLEELIRTPSAGNPLYLKVVLSDLRVFGSYAALHGQLRTRYGDDPQSAFAELLRRLETDPAYTPVASGDIVPLLFGLLAHARAGLAAGEAAAIAVARLGLGDALDAEDAVNLVLRQVRTFTARRLGRHDFLHSSFRGAAQARYTREDWHGLLADYFDGLPLDSRRRLAELPYHLTAAGRDERARDVLCDLRFVDAKCAAGMTTELIADYEAARPLDPLPVFTRFARTESHNLARYATTPGFTVQQATNSAASGPVREAGLRLASASWLELLDPPQTIGGALQATLEGLADGATEAAFVPAEAALLAAGRDGSALIWDAESWRRLCKVVQLETGIDTCAVSAGGDLVALGCDDGYVRVHDRAANATIVCEGKFDQSPRRCRFLPDGRLLSVGRFGLMIHDPATGERLHAHEAGLTVCDWALGPGGIVALAGSEGAVSLYDLEAAAVVKTLYLDRDEGIAWACSFSPDGSRLLAGGGKLTYSDDVAPFGQSSVWRTDTWEVDHEHGHDVMATACCFHRDDTYVIGLLDGSLRVYGADGEQLGTVGAHSSTVRSLRTAGDLLVSASLDGRVRAWSVPSLLDGAPGAAGRGLFCAGDSTWTGSPQPRFEYEFQQAGTKLWMDRDVSFGLRMFRRDASAPLTGVRILYDGPTTAPHATDPTHGPGEYWLLASASRMRPFDISLLPALPAELHSPENVRWARSPDGGSYALLRRGQLAWVPVGGRPPPRAIDFECDPNVFHLPQVSLSADGLRVYFIAGERLYGFDPLRGVTTILHASESGPLHAFCESPDGSRIAVARDDGALCVVQATTAGPVEEYRGHDGPVIDCAWLGNVPLSLGRDGSLRLWGPAQAVFVGMTAITAFSASERIVAADAGGRVYVLAPHLPVS